MTPPAILVLLLRLVPALDGMIRAGLADADMRDTVMAVIRENRSDDFAEWGDIEMYIRQEQALARAAA